MKLQSLEVEGLFGYLNHHIQFHPSDPTVLIGMNGSGKTHILRLAEALINGNIRALMRLPFNVALLTVDGGIAIEARHIPDPRVNLLKYSVSMTGQENSILIRRDPNDSEMLPSWIGRGPGGTYFDERKGQRVDPSDLDRYLENESGLTLDERQAMSNLRAGLSGSAVLIDTKRIDQPRLPSPAQRRRPAQVIDGYLDSIRLAILDARAEATAVAQNLDSTFAERALAGAQKRPREDRLRDEYNQVVSLHKELSQNGLALDAEPIVFPSHTTETQRRILAPFIRDWEKRLLPLRALNEKISLFRNLVDSKLRESFKATVVRDGRLLIEDIHGRRITPTHLSSGEQHIIALYTRILFGIFEGDVVLIDEPEISLHPAWQEVFLADLDKICDLVSVQPVVATHSPTLLANHWELEVALPLTPPPAPQLDRDGESSGGGFVDTIEDAFDE